MNECNTEAGIRMSAELKIVWQKGGGESKKALYGMIVGESLRKLFYDEGLAFKTGQPFALLPHSRCILRILMNLMRVIAVRYLIGINEIGSARSMGGRSGDR